MTRASETPFAGVAGRFDAALSTHGLLHGTARSMAFAFTPSQLGSMPSGLLFATFGSTRDSRFGRGERLDDSTFAPDDGDERGVPHAYFDRDRLVALFEPYFEIESLDEQGVDDVAGTWAHHERPLAGACIGSPRPANDEAASRAICWRRPLPHSRLLAYREPAYVRLAC